MAIAVTSVVAMMLVVSYDAISRYAFNKPLPWSFELVTYYLLVTAIYFAIGSTFRHGDHVNIDLFLSNMPTKLRRVFGIVNALLAAAAFAIIAYGTSHSVYEAYVQREFLPGYIVWPAWLSHFPIPIGATLIALRLLHHAFTLARIDVDPEVVAAGAEQLE